RHLLERAFQPIGHLVTLLLDRRPRPGGAHEHGLDGEVGILAAAEVPEGQGAGDGAEKHEEDDQALALDRPFGQVEAAIHRRLPSSRRTAMPGRNCCAPATMTWSPSAMPLVT